MRQIKEKAPATPASVTSATQNLQEDDTIKHSKKQPFKVSEYLEYCDCMAKQPNQNLIEFMESNNEPYQYSGKVRNDWELVEEITALSPSGRDDIIELIEFFVWQNQRKKSYIA